MDYLVNNTNPDSQCISGCTNLHLSWKIHVSCNRERKIIIIVVVIINETKRWTGNVDTEVRRAASSVRAATLFFPARRFHSPRANGLRSLQNFCFMFAPPPHPWFHRPFYTIRIFFGLSLCLPSLLHRYSPASCTFIVIIFSCLRPPCPALRNRKFLSTLRITLDYWFPISVTSEHGNAVSKLL